MLVVNLNLTPNFYSHWWCLHLLFIVFHFYWCLIWCSKPFLQTDICIPYVFKFLFVLNINTWYISVFQLMFAKWSHLASEQRARTMKLLAQDLNKLLNYHCLGAIVNRCLCLLARFHWSGAVLFSIKHGNQPLLSKWNEHTVNKHGVCCFALATAPVEQWCQIRSHLIFLMGTWSKVHAILSGIHTLNHH